MASNPSPATATPARERIVAAAYEAFTQNGYAGASTLEIATRAKVSKRDLYANFFNKQDILLGCITSRAQRMRLPAGLSAPHNREALAARLSSFGATVLREVSHPAVIAMYRLAMAEATRAPEAALTLEASRLANRAAITDLFQRAQADGILGPGDPSFMMERYFALLWGDLLLKLLFGVAAAPATGVADERARLATEAFINLHAQPDRDTLG
jgi:AcrR family transcriptional regulator